MAVAKYLLLISFSLLTPVTASSGYDFVDPLIGTVNGGHVFPGATLPFGMAKAVADVNGEAQGGFASDGSQITGELPWTRFRKLQDRSFGGLGIPKQIAVVKIQLENIH